MSEERPDYGEPSAKRSAGIPIGQWSGSDATEQIERTVRAFGESSERQSRAMLQLTRWIIALTVAMLAAVLVQIAIMLGAGA